MKRIIITIMCLILVAFNILLPMQPAHAFATEAAIIYGLVSGLLSLGTGMATSSAYNMQVINAIENSGQEFIDSFTQAPFNIGGSVITGAALITALSSNNIVNGKLQVGKNILQSVSNWLSNYTHNNDFNYVDTTTAFNLESNGRYLTTSNTPIDRTIIRVGGDATTNVEIEYYYDVYPIYAREVLQNVDYEIYYLYVLRLNRRATGNMTSTNTGACSSIITKEKVAYPTTGNAIAYQQTVQTRNNYLIETEQLYNESSSPYQIASYRDWAGMLYGKRIIIRRIENEQATLHNCK